MGLAGFSGWMKEGTLPDSVHPKATSGCVADGCVSVDQHGRFRVLLHCSKRRGAIGFASGAAAALFIHGAATAAPSSPDLNTGTFAAFNRICRASAALWGASSCGPLMLVDPDTRRAVANQADAAGILKPIVTGLFAGTLAADVVLSNTATDVGGTHWAMVLLPLPSDAAERDVLLAHEAFHRVQPAIGITSADTEGRNGHLDREQGRLWLQLEARALNRALIALATETDPRPAVRDALAFRAERRRLFSTAAVDEDALDGSRERPNTQASWLQRTSWRRASGLRDKTCRACLLFRLSRALSPMPPGRRMDCCSMPLLVQVGASSMSLEQISTRC